MPKHAGSIVTPTAFGGKEDLAEERAEYRAVQRSGGDVKKAMRATKARRAGQERKMASTR